MIFEVEVERSVLEVTTVLVNAETMNEAKDKAEVYARSEAGVKGLEWCFVDVDGPPYAETVVEAAKYYQEEDADC